MNRPISLSISILLFMLLTACNAIPNISANPVASSDNGVAQVGLTPQETVETFLDAWASESFETMHSLLSPRSVAIYPLDEFSEQYTSAHSDMGFSDVSYTIHDVQVQGTSAAVNYDVDITTDTFGTISDEGRTIRLVQENGGWTLAWSPMDIINGMTANVRLDSNRTFDQRGNIYDTNGQLLVNETGTTYAVRLVLSDMLNVDDCTALLSRVMLRPTTYFTSLYINYQAADSAFFVGEIDEVTHNRYRADLDAVCGTNIDIPLIGAKILPQVGRTYFGHGAAAHITGYLGRVPVENLNYWVGRGYSETDLVGLSGIEFTFQDELSGVPDQSLRLIDSSSGVPLRSFGSSSGSEAASVTLTIDRDLQWNTAQAFIDAWNYAGPNWVTRATGGAAVVMDVNSGAILSMFSFPTYDPRIFLPGSGYFVTSTVGADAFAQIDDASTNNDFLPLGPALRNRAYGEQYSPGSVFKILSTLAAADSDTWQADEIFECNLIWEGQRYGDSLEFREDWRVVEEMDAAGPITMSTALTTSCNPFFWEVGMLMYDEQPNMLHNYAEGWGFGQPTGIENLSGEAEASGINPIPASPGIAANNVIGQGDTQVTALQMARLVAAVANGGTLYQPYIVQQVGGTDGDPVLETFEPIVAGQLDVTPEALRITQEGMCNVPIDTDFGTSTLIFGDNPIPPSYTSCGKTGTAQASTAPNSWYVAYAPADNPQVAIAVVVPNSREGSQVSAPIVRRILDLYFGGAVAEFPDWWVEPYVPVDLPQGVGG